MDEAVSLFGHWVDSEIQRAQDNVKDVKVATNRAMDALRACLVVQEETAEAEEPLPPPKGRFADPAMLLKGR